MGTGKQQERAKELPNDLFANSTEKSSRRRVLLEPKGKFCWVQNENTRRIDQERFDEKQNRKDHFEEEIRNGKKEFQKRWNQEVDPRGDQGKSKSWNHRILRSQEGKRPLQ